LITAPFSRGLAGDHAHQGGRQGRDEKKEKPADAQPAQDAGPFDPAAVTQVLTRVSNGTIRRVTANETSDAQQIGLIRANLKKQAEQFSNGTLPTPSHARSPVAGFSVLQAAAPGQLRGQYFEVRAGGEIHYTADDPSLAAALQLWLDSESPAGTAPPVSIMRRSQGPQ
jgi:hypothetical protein